MSRKNVEVVRAIYEAINRNAMVDAVRLMTRDVEWVNPAYAVEAGTRRGYRGFMTAIETLRQTFPKLEYSIESVQEHGGGVVVNATFRSGGANDMSWPRYHLWTLRDGKVCRLQWFSDLAEALKAAGLSDIEA